MTDQPPPPAARILTKRRPFQIVWIIPIVAAGIAGYLGYRAVMARGPTITVTFNTADGLQAGQTNVRHKAVNLGTVQSIALSEDMQRVVVRIQMLREATRFLTDHARFWVVRARLGLGGVSGLDTLLSGAFIEMDPGEPGGTGKTAFTGLEEPPAIRSDEPGTTFRLAADRIGSLSSGSPVFYRDIVAGEVLGYDLGPNGDNVTIHVFVKAPFDKYVHAATHFWNASGLALNFGAQGVSLRIESLQAVLAGGVAFDSSSQGERTPVSPAEALFTLYSDQAAAQSAGYLRRVTFMTRFRDSVRGLAVGAPVEIDGIQVGQVTGVELHFDHRSLHDTYVEVRFDIQPERIMARQEVSEAAMPDAVQHMVDEGLRVQLRSANIITGQMMLALATVPEAAPARVTLQDGIIVVPSVAGGFEGIIANVAQITDKFAAMPIDAIARNLNDTLAGFNKIANGTEVKDAIKSVAAAMVGVNDVVRALNAGIAPAIKRLPDIAQGLQSTIDRANRLVASVDTGYGDNSEFRRNLTRLLAQAGDTARSLRLLADFLDQHPEALLRGRSGRGGD